MLSLKPFQSLGGLLEGGQAGVLGAVVRVHVDLDTKCGQGCAVILLLVMVMHNVRGTVATGPFAHFPHAKVNDITAWPI